MVAALVGGTSLAATADDSALLSGRLIGAAEGSTVVVTMEPPAIAGDEFLRGVDLAEFPTLALGKVGPGGHFEIELPADSPVLPSTSPYVNIIIEQDGPDADHMHVDTLHLDGEGPMSLDVGNVKSKEMLIAEAGLTEPSLEPSGPAREPSEAEGIADAGGFRLEQVHGQNTYLRELDNVPMTSFVIGNNTTYVAAKAGITHGSTHRMGWAFDSGGGWAKGSGTYTRETSSSFGVTWEEDQMPMSSYGSWILRVTADQGVYRKMSHHNFEEFTSPRVVSGSKSPSRASVTSHTHCAPMGGTTKITTGDGTNWSNGLKLSSFGFGFNVMSETDFKSTAWVQFRPTTANRWLCGRYAKPGNAGAGDFTADWKDR